MTSQYTALTFFFALALIQLQAFCDETSSEAKAHQRADTYFARGEVLFEARDFIKAAEAFNLAYEISPHHSVLSNIALSYEKAGKQPEAVVKYREYLSALEETGATDEDTAKRLSRLLEQVGELEVNCAGKSCQIQVDGVARGQAPMNVIVYPGTHLIEAFFLDQTTQAIHVNIEAGETADASLSWEPPLDFNPDESKQESDHLLLSKTEGRPAALGTPFWVFTGLTGASAITVAVLGARALDARDRLVATGRTDKDIAEQGEQYQLATNVMIGVTGAFGIVAVIFLVKDLAFSSPDYKEGTEISLTAGPGMGLGIAGRFF